MLKLFQAKIIQKFVSSIKFMPSRRETMKEINSRYYEDISSSKEDGSDLISLMHFMDLNERKEFDKIDHICKRLLPDIATNSHTHRDENDIIADMTEKGVTLNKLNKYLEALACFDNVLKLEPDNVAALTEKGVAFPGLKKFDDAIKNFAKVVSQDPGNEAAIDKLAKLHQADFGNKNVDKPLNTLKGHSDSVNSVAITSDNKIVSGSHDKTIKVWDLKTGKLLNTLKGHSKLVKSVAITSDNSKIVSGSFDNTIKVWELNTGKLLNTLVGHSG